MSITFDDVTILSWSEQRFMKTIHHRPDIDPPLLPVNKTLVNQRENMKFPISQLCEPCCPAYIHTSKVVAMPTIINNDENIGSLTPAPP